MSVLRIIFEAPETFLTLSNYKGNLRLMKGKLYITQNVWNKLKSENKHWHLGQTYENNWDRQRVIQVSTVSHHNNNIVVPKLTVFQDIEDLLDDNTLEISGKVTYFKYLKIIFLSCSERVNIYRCNIQLLVIRVMDWIKLFCFCF